MVVKLNGFQANDAYGSSNGDIFEESWYNQFDALSGMEYFILATKLHAGSEEPMTPKCRLTFDPPKFLIEINDHMSHFFRKLTFDPVRTIQ